MTSAIPCDPNALSDLRPRRCPRGCALSNPRENPCDKGISRRRSAIPTVWSEAALSLVRKLLRWVEHA